MSEGFDRGIDLRPVGREGSFQGSIERSWWIDRGPNGGYIASLMLAGLQAALGDPERYPVSFTIHYVERPVEGEVEVAATIERSGRSMTTTSGRLIQDGRLLALALGTFSVARRSGHFGHLPMPEVPDPEDLQEVPVPAEMLPPFVQHFEYRYALGSFPYSSAERAFIGGWIRPRPERIVDALIIPTFADGWPPAVFVRHSGPVGVPTIDLTVHFRAPLPSPGSRPGNWTLMQFESRHAGNGLIEESGTMWSRDGTLIAQSRQLALYRDDVSYWPGT